VKHQTEIELKFLVPATARAGVGAEMSRGSTTLERISLAAMYLDTRDRRLAAAGLSWRLRREGRRWIQTLKAGAHHSPYFPQLAGRNLAQT
jgi:inorganic triphosphatase YgiF